MASTGARVSPAASTEEELAGLYARCLAVYYAPVDEDFGMVPYEAFLAEKPVVTTTDAGGPLEVVADRRTGLVSSRTPAALAEACSWLRDHVDDAKAWGQAGKEIARACPGTRRSRACSRESRLLLAAAPGAVRDRRLLRAAAACARAARGGRGRAARAHAARGRGRRALPRRQRPGSHGWIVDALRRRPGVVVLHDFVLHHLVAGLTIGRKDGHGYLAAMERDAGIPGRLLAHGVLDGRVSPPWETRPDEFPLTGEVLATRPA